jgi:hypothetical protein
MTRTELENQNQAFKGLLALMVVATEVTTRELLGYCPNTEFHLDQLRLTSQVRASLESMGVTIEVDGVPPPHH